MRARLKKNLPLRQRLRRRLHNSAWAATADLDKTIVEAMAKGKQAILKGTPQKGKPTTDTYSLAGFVQALAMIDKACGIKR